MKFIDMDPTTITVRDLIYSAIDSGRIIHVNKNRIDAFEQGIIRGNDSLVNQLKQINSQNETNIELIIQFLENEETL